MGVSRKDYHTVGINKFGEDDIDDILYEEFEEDDAEDWDDYAEYEDEAGEVFDSIGSYIQNSRQKRAS